ncbi:MAG: argonaute PAZ domain-containing protein [Thermus sp.]
MERLMETQSVILNRFLLRRLREEELVFQLLEVDWEPPPSREENPFSLLGRVARRLGRGVTPWNGRLLARHPVGVGEGEVKGDAGAYRFRLRTVGPITLDPKRPEDQRALERLAQRELEEGLKRLAQRRNARPGSQGRYQVEGGLLLGKEVQGGEGWRILMGSSLRARVQPQGLFLEVDIVHRIVPTLTLEEWLHGHPPPRRVRSTYLNQAGRRQTWSLVAVEAHLRPEEVMVGEVSLLAYHQALGRLGEGEDPGRVVRLRDERGEVYHLTALLEPVLSLEDLAELYPDGLPSLQIPPGHRLTFIRQVANEVAREVFRVGAPEPLRAEGQVLDRPQLRARGRVVGKPADALRVGALRPLASRVGLLVVDGPPAWPKDLEAALGRLAARNRVELVLEPPVPVSRGELRSLSLAAALDALAQKGVRALLVFTPPLLWEERNALKQSLLQRGLPSQFFNPPLDGHKLDNVLLGLLSDDSPDLKSRASQGFP